MDAALALAPAFQALAPRSRQYLLGWSLSHIVTEQGRPYDHAAYPHIGAPGGPMDAWDSPYVREIVLQWATRLGKTFIGQCATLYTLDTDPAPVMLCSATEKLAKEVAARSYTMMHARRELNDLLVKAEKFQRQDCIETRGANVFIAWARSASTLADKNIKIGHANEIDKWEHASTAKEADPLKLFSDRFKDYQSNRKIIYEGTPTIQGRSRIEGLRLEGSNRAYYVPCPHCKRYQRLVWARVRWDDPPACYVCEHCEMRVEDYHRPWSIRRGVWVPAGANVIDDAALQIAETSVHETRISRDTWSHQPWHDGRAKWERESMQLSSLYALSLRWSDFQNEFQTCQSKPQLLRNFINQWLGETWELRRGKSSLEQIAERCAGTYHRGDRHPDSQFVIVAADQQAADGGFIKWVATAHRFNGPEEWAWLIDYGHTSDLSDLWANVVAKYSPMLTAIDSGYQTKATYDFASRHPRCLPVKGSSGDLGGQPYRIATIDGCSVGLVHVNTDYWETDLQHRLDHGTAGNPGAITLCREASRDMAFLHELTNAALDDVVDPRGVVKLRWVKKNESAPNDYRDALRYALCLASIYHRARGVIAPPTADDRHTDDDRGGFVRRPSWVK